MSAYIDIDTENWIKLKEMGRAGEGGKRERERKKLSNSHASTAIMKGFIFIISLLNVHL